MLRPAESATDTQTQTLDARVDRVEQLAFSPTATLDGTFDDGCGADLRSRDAVAGREVLGVDQEQGFVIGSDALGQWTEDDSHELRRVKIYAHIGSRSVEQGTGFCLGDFRNNEALQIARAKADSPPPQQGE